MLGIANFVNLLRDPVSQVRQGVVSAMLSVFCEQYALPRLQTALVESESLVRLVVTSLETSPAIVRGKYYLLLAAVCRQNNAGLLKAVKGKLMSFLERDDRASHSDDASTVYLNQCGAALLRVLISAGQDITAETASVLGDVVGRNHPSNAQTRALKPALATFPFVLHAVTSPLVRRHLLSDRFIADLAACVRLLQHVMSHHTNLDVVAPGAGMALVRDVMAVTESLSQLQAEAEGHKGALVEHLLPSVLHIACMSDDLEPSEDAVRVLCLRIVGDFIARLGRADRTALDRLISSHLGDELIAACFQLLQGDTEPTPTYAARALNSMIEGCADVTKRLLDAGIATAAFAAFQRKPDGESSLDDLQPSLMLFRNQH